MRPRLLSWLGQFCFPRTGIAVAIILLGAFVLAVEVTSGSAKAAAPKILPGVQGEVSPGLFGDCERAGTICTWEEVIGGRLDDEAHAVAEMPDGGYTLAGHTRSHGMRTHGTPGEDGAVSVAMADDVGFALAGYTQPPGLSNFDNRVIRLSPKGNMLWERHFASGIFSTGTAISAASTPDGGVVVVSAAQPGGLSESNARLVRFTPEGEIV